MYFSCHNPLILIDNFKHQGLRKQLIQELKTKGITDTEVLNAIMAVPRHVFMDNAFLQFAYEDKAFPIGSGQTISQPYTVAFQSSLLQLKKGMKVLEIGTGSGYQTAVLCEMGAKVFSVERHRPLHLNSKRLLESLGYKAKLFYGDGYIGIPAFAPFDRIIVTAGAPYIPEDLKSQLKLGGILVIPVTTNDSEVMKLIVRKSETEYTEEDLGSFKFVPMLKNKV